MLAYKTTCICFGYVNRLVSVTAGHRIECIRDTPLSCKTAQYEMMEDEKVMIIQIWKIYMNHKC